MDRIKHAVCAAFGVSEDALEPATRGITTDPRDISIYLARTLTGGSLKHIGEYFNIKKYSTVGSAVS